MRHKLFSLLGLLFILTILAPGAVSAVGSQVNGNDIFLPMVLNNRTSSVMIQIPAGEFQMGCDLDHNGGYTCPYYEVPLHTVYLDAYYIDKYEVTNAQVAAFLNNRASNDCGGYECIYVDDGDCRISWDGSQYVVDAGYGNHPVVEVTWYGADTYCSENSKRLPTEAEWEKAARGTSVRAYPWGDGAPNCTLANYYGCIGGTAPVGSYPSGASSYGVLDMAGNAWEWVNDWYLSSYYSSSPYSNPPGPVSGTYRVMRGGSRFSYSDFLRVAYRYRYNPVITYLNVGFRCARSP